MPAAVCLRFFQVHTEIEGGAFKADFERILDRLRPLDTISESYVI
jgi:hypothetical protein